MPSFVIAIVDPSLLPLPRPGRRLALSALRPLTLGP